jgi:hypothetical protein
MTAIFYNLLIFTLFFTIKQLTFFPQRQRALESKDRTTSGLSHKTGATEAWDEPNRSATNL